jgi:hypothetical protein
MTVFQIAAHADSMMSFPRKFAAADYANLYATAREINGAFSGPIETIANSASLQLTGVTNPEAGTFLHIAGAQPDYTSAPLTVEPITAALSAAVVEEGKF